MLSASFCFGEWSLENTAGMSSYSSFYHNEYDIFNGYSFGLSSRVKIHNNFGIGAHFNYLYFSEIASGNSSDGSMIIKNKDCELLFAFDFLLGPSFLLFNDSKFKLPITLGFKCFGMVILMDMTDYVPEEYKYVSTGKPELTIYQYMYGVGFSVSAEYHFTKRFYLIGRVQGGLDFVGFSTAETKVPTIVGTFTSTDEDHGLDKMFSINPQIGIGIQF